MTKDLRRMRGQNSAHALTTKMLTHKMNDK